MRPILRITTLLAAGALAISACGTDTEPVDLGAAPTSTVPPTTEPSEPAEPTETVTVTIYFTRGDELAPTTRTVPVRGDDDLVAADALRALLAGPTTEEVAAGMGSEIPEGTRLLDVRIGTDRIATVDLSGEFETGGGSASMLARLGQVACTMDNVVELDIADGTRFLLDGQPVQVFSNEGIVLDGPVTCADYQPRDTAGAATPACIAGWTSPPAGDPLRAEALDLLRISTAHQGRFVVEDIRYFVGPDTIDPGLEVEHWYIKARAEADSSFRGRFLVLRRNGSGGVVAVAPFDTNGWESPDWAGFEGEGELTAFPDLPGRWAGVRYDFVTGTGGPGTPGLPGAVRGCLDGT
jgi:spore germination protein GerM